MIQIYDFEGEVVVTLTDIESEEDLNQRLEKIDKKVLKICSNCRWGCVVGSKYDPYLEEEREGIHQIIFTFDEWINNCTYWSHLIIEDCE